MRLQSLEAVRVNERLSRMRFKAASMYGLRCFVCRRPYGPRFQFHHLQYPKEWKTYRDFKSSQKYNEYIVPKIMAHPDIFRLLCWRCHELVSMVQRVRGRQKFERLLDTCVKSRLGGGGGASTAKNRRMRKA